MNGRLPGVALLNLGSPASPADVRPFLRRLFLDIELFRFPGERWFRPLFAAGISALRAGRIRRLYRVIGGISPLLSLTRSQAAALEAALAERGIRVPVEPCMRYSRPATPEAVRRLVSRGARQLLALPLYPQFSRSTTGSSLRAFREAAERLRPGLPVREIPWWYDDPGFQGAIARRVAASVERLGGVEAEVGVLFVAHSLPLRLVEEGDPYVAQVEETVEGVLAEMGRGDPGVRVPWRLAYQSRVGPVRWVGPTVPKVVEEMVGSGLRRIVVAPVSFVSDHLETLVEIDLVYRRYALERGAERFERIESLNASDDFILALADRIVRSWGRGRTGVTRGAAGGAVG